IGLSVVFGMTLGIVVDYTVHFLSKFLRAKRENQLSTEDAIRYAFSTVGVALLVTTFILFANFAVLAISDFSMNSDMGLMTAVTIVVALLVDFFFLPPLLLFLVGSKRKKAKQDLTIDDQGILDQRAPLNG
ncbi:MMPL family transporter, partial [Oleiphilus sp. HI0123]